MYRASTNGMIQRLADGAFIPENADNRDYQAFLAWQAAGNTPEPAPPAPWPELTKLQLRLGLLSAGLTAAVVEAAIAKIADPDQRERAMIFWQDSTSYTRTHPLVAALGTALGLEADQIDALWRTAHAGG